MFFLPKLELLQKTVKTETRYKGLDLRPAAEETTLSDCVGISASAFPALSVCNPLTRVQENLSISYEILCPGNGELLELSIGRFTTITRHYTMQDGTPLTNTFSLSIGESVLSSACFMGDLILLVRSNRALRLYRYDKACTKIEDVDLSDLLNAGLNGTLSMFCFHNRVVILQNDEMHIGYAMSLTRWQDYLPESQYELPLAAQHNQFPGQLFTCGVYYRSRPVLFDSNAMHLLYNTTKPFSSVKTADVGCINPRSVAICNGVLCFLSADGVMAYNGTGLPYKISEQLPDISVTAANSGGCAFGDCYYLGEYVYCFGTNQWTKLFQPAQGDWIRSIYTRDEKLYFVITTSEGHLTYEYDPNRFNSTLKPLSWSFTTQEFHEEEPGKKKLTQLAFRVEPIQETTFQVDISIEGGAFVPLCNRTLEKNSAQEIRVKTPPGENFRLKVSGSGKLTIAYFRRVYQLLSDGKIHPFL